MEDLNQENRIKLDCIRLCNLLDQNLLVQANAIVQKMEHILQEELAKCNPKEIENHRYFKAFKLIHIIRSFVLSGKQEDASLNATSLKEEIFRS